jgi:hypothetical protein
MPSLNVQSTPNPDSVKLSQKDRKFANDMYSFDSPEQATDHPLGRALISIEGVDNVFILPDFVTVTKKSEVSWDEILPSIKRLIRESEHD